MLFVILIIGVYNSFGQISTDMIKYWYYRNRLNNYFVVPGDKYGESQIICVRNVIRSDNDLNADHSKGVDYGQHGLFTGLYLGTLATEYYLLNKNGQYEDRDKTGDELNKALNAIRIWWDEAAEYYWPGEDLDPSPDGNFNGFFIRGNVPCDFFSNVDPIRPNGLTYNGLRHVDLLNIGLKTTDVWNENEHRFGNLQYGGFLPRGHPGYIDHRTCDKCEGQSDTSDVPLHDAHGHDFHPESMSKDEAIMILMGCALTIKLVGGNIGQLASTMKQKIVEVLVNAHHTWGSTPYQIYEPGHIVPEGGNSLVYAKPLNLLIGVPPANADNFSWQVMSWFGWDGGDQTAVLAAMTDSWVCTGSGINNVTHRHNWQSFYTLLWEVLQNKTRPDDKQDKIEELAIDQLDNAPCEGPYCYKADDDDGNGGIYSGEGWASTYKWFKNKKGQDHGDERWIGNYNGADYMFLYNLYHIIKYTDCPYYVNYVDKTIPHYLPQKYSWGSGFTYGTNSYPAKYTAFNSLTSSQEIGIQTRPDITDDPGNVTFVAETSIHLKPGFHAMEGCYFHAYISDIDCGGNEGKTNMSSDYPDNIYTPFSDSIISLPKTPYELTLEDTTGNNSLLTLSCPIDTIRFMGMNGDTTEFDYYYYWDFGNGVTSTKKDPKVFYEPGTYNFTLILTDTNNVSDTANLIIEVPDCENSIHGTLSESAACGSVALPFDTIYLVNAADSVVLTVSPVVTDTLGRFWFADSHIAGLDSTALFGFKSSNGYVLDDTAHRTIGDWLGLNPLQFSITNFGKREWQQIYTSSSDSAVAFAKAVDINENIYVLGKIYSDSADFDYVTLKYSPAGVLKWVRTYNSTYNSTDLPSAICTDSLCNIYVTGSSKDGGGKEDYLTIKYDSAGTQQWVERYDASGNGSSLDFATALKADGTGNVYVAGHSMDANDEVNLVTIKYNSVGQQQWVRTFYDGDYSQTTLVHHTSLCLDSMANVYLAGTCKDSLGDNEYLLLKYNASGTLQWTAKKNINAQQIDNATSIALDGAGNVFTTGNSGTVKYNNSGTFQWLQAGNFTKVIVDGSGNVYAGNDAPEYLTKYDNATGTIAWSNDSVQVLDLISDDNNELYVVSEDNIKKIGSTGDILAAVTVAFDAVSGGVSSNLNLYIVGSISQTTNGHRSTGIVTTKYSQCPSVATLKGMAPRPPSINTMQMVEKTSSIKIIPNPNNGEMLLLSNDNFETGSVFMINDLAGRVLYTKKITEKSNSVPISTSYLENGIYIYSIYSAQGKMLAKDKLVIMK